MKKSLGLGILCTSITQKKKKPISDDFGLRSPVVQNAFQPKRGIP